MKTKAEIEPGSPEDRILKAVLESTEASGQVITPEIRERITTSFMIGYTAGFSISGAQSIGAFCSKNVTWFVLIVTQKYIMGP